MDPNVLPPHSPWKEADSIWPATSFILHRNLSPFRFPTHMTEVEAEQTLGLITNYLSNQPSIKIIRGDSLAPLDKEILFEHFILQEGFEKFDPGRGLIIDDTGLLLGLINVEDHLHLHLFAVKESLDVAYQKLTKLERELAKTLTFSYSDRFGYLTSDPRICGTGLVVQAFLHLPAMIHLKQFSEFVEKLGEEVIVHGLGQEGEYIADIVLVENRFKLGVTEENILKTVENAARALKEEEQRLRKNLKESDTELLKDKVGRSYGLLSNAYTLNVMETLSNLSLFHLGKELEWITKADELDFCDLFFTIRRGHLQRQFAEKTTKEALSQKRAEFLREKVTASKLII